MTNEGRQPLIDLNADLGEGFGPYAFGQDDELLDIVTSANIACGFHAGDPHVMRRTVDACVRRGVAIGAHPGLPDRMGFGRREIAASPDEAADWIAYQIGALQAFAAAAGTRVRHVKLHGALYHMAARDDGLAAAAVRAVRAVDPALAIFGPPGSRLEAAARRADLAFAAEGFADRAYQADGTLAPRGASGAVFAFPDQALRQALAMVTERRVVTLEGAVLPMAVRTICLHGDTPSAVRHAALLADGLRAAGVRLAAFGSLPVDAGPEAEHP